MPSPSGKFVVRVPPELHERLKFTSLKAGLSLNKLCVQRLEARSNPSSALEIEIQTGLPLDHFGLRPILASLLRGPFSLEGLALFGSSARGEATEGSDVDLLIVLASSGAIDRSLYDWWHAHTEALHKKGTPSLSPHFVALPAKPSTVGSLWYEVAREGVICWDRNFRVTSVLRELREAMERGEVIRKVTYGHPYWVKIQEPIK